MRPRLRLVAFALFLAAPAAAQTPPAASPPLVATQNYLVAGVEPDLAFGAYQRGYYLTALREAMSRIQAKKSDVAAMTLVGELYKDGLGVRRDPAEAARWFKLASDRGDREASFALALAHLEGKGVDVNGAKATALLTAAAAAGHPAAAYQLGLLALTNDLQDPAKAAEWFSRAVDLGDTDAVYALGLMYKDGRGVVADPVRAADLLRRAADARLAAAEVDYAIMLFNGKGVEKDEKGAAAYFLRAAGANNPVAMNRIARLYVEGRGVPVDMVEAMKWHILARSAGESDAWLDSQLARLTPRDRAAVEESIRRQVGN